MIEEYIRRQLNKNHRMAITVTLCVLLGYTIFWSVVYYNLYGNSEENTFWLFAAVEAFGIFMVFFIGSSRIKSTNLILKYYKTGTMLKAEFNRRRVSEGRSKFYYYVTISDGMEEKVYQVDNEVFAAFYKDIKDVYIVTAEHKKTGEEKIIIMLTNA